MRVVDAALQALIDNSQGIKLSARLTVYNNRVFVDTVSPSYAPGFAETPSIHSDNPLAQDCGYDVAISKVITVVASSDNKLKILLQGSTTVITASYSAADIEAANWSRPTIKPPYIFYCDTAGILYKLTYNPTLVNSGTNACITAKEVIDNSLGSTIKGSLYGLDENNAVFLFIDNGGVGVSHYSKDGTWSDNTWINRFMFPIEVWLSTTTEVAPDYSKLRKLNFAGVAILDSNIYVYLTQPDGSVKGVHINSAGNWSDTFVAVPSDLTSFWISNCFVDSSDRFHLVGQFERTENYSTGSVYTLSLWSDNGIVFSLDRFTLVSVLGYRFMETLSADHILLCDCNRIAERDPSYTFFREDATKLVVAGIIAISGSFDNGWQFVVSNYADIYSDNPLLTIGNIAILEMGVKGVSTTTWVNYDKCVIGTVEDTSGDAIRRLTMTILPEGLWRAGSITYPFYLEIQSKQSVRDDADRMDNLYNAPNSHGIFDPFYCVFSPEDSAFTPQAHNNTTVTHWSGDLIEQNYLDDYPVIDEFPLTVKIYGWSRIGLMSRNPNVADSTPISNPNDDFIPCFLVEDEQGLQRTVDIYQAADADNGISYPPQTWKAGNARASTGRYPVTYTIQEGIGLMIGDKVIKGGVKVRSFGPTVYTLERMEIPE